MRGFFVTSIMLGAAICGDSGAAPKKPTAAQAKATAEKWLDDISKAAPLTGFPLFSIADGDSTQCEAETTKTAAELPKRLECLGKVINTEEVVPYTAKLAKKMQGLRAFKKNIATLQKTATLVMHHEACAGQGSELVMAVALDGETPKVVAVLYQDVFCGE